MEENSKKKEPQLREIKAPGSYRSNAATRALSGGLGTGPNDCMSLENYLVLCRNSALKSEVYVCGEGWLSPEEYYRFEWSGSSGSPGSSGSGSSGSDGSSSSGNSDEYRVISSENVNYEWESWSEWSGWTDFSAESWDYPEKSGLELDQKNKILREMLPQAFEICGKQFNVRVHLKDEPCMAAAMYKNGEIVVCDEFFTFNSNDQISILWHEVYHRDNGHDVVVTGDNLVSLSSPVRLEPKGDLLGCLEKIYEIDKKHGEHLPGISISLQTKYDRDIHPSQWYRNEIETYKAEMKNGVPKSERYLCIERWNLWKFEALLKIAEEEEKKQANK